MWYGGEKISKIKEELKVFVKREDIEKALACLEKESLEKASVALNPPPEEIGSILQSLLSLRDGLKKWL